MARKKAFVTGASRGIGKGIALRLARGGYDVAVTARSVAEGEQREHSSTLQRSDTSAIPGSLSTTADDIRAAGGEALVLPADLLDRASLTAAAKAMLEQWGRVDLVVHNGRYVGPGLKDMSLNTPVDVLATHIEANALAPMVLNHVFVPAMIEQGSGTIIYITSNAAYKRPFATVEKGGWGLCYAMSKAAGHAIAGMLAKEYRDKGLRAFNLEPGATMTERIAQEMGNVGHEHLPWEPVDVVAETAYWLATSPDADAFNGKNLESQVVCQERNLLPGWTPKVMRV